MIPIQNFKIDQVGLVVDDIKSFSSQFKKLFNIGQVRIVHWPIEGIDPNATLYGERASWRMYLGFAELGNIKLEFIQPIEGDNIFTRFLQEHGPGLHHLRFTVDNFDDVAEEFKSSGYPIIASGDGVHIGSRWAFFDTAKDLQGLIVELRTKISEEDEKNGWLEGGDS